ncbi:basic-leucine zipper transcription factor A-like [Physella acuta]|uniref:basic-leucine zipper transcription factor A-like n=1 Tax=Physella acuta TaxID=109671 RepID=UPI0027DB4376|nr:basic-leucine zipper transcription factor A-like [Physella acuta]
MWDFQEAAGRGRTVMWDFQEAAGRGRTVMWDFQEAAGREFAIPQSNKEGGNREAELEDSAPKCSIVYKHTPAALLGPPSSRLESSRPGGTRCSRDRSDRGGVRQTRHRSSWAVSRLIGFCSQSGKLDSKINNDRVSTTASESRKSSKPIMEKRRRARINASLAELKTLLLETIKKEGARHNKMEKADILEMAVKHLRQIQRQQLSGESSSEPTAVSKYSLGYHACAQEVSKYLGDNSDEAVELRTKLLNHLANCITNRDFPTQPNTQASTSYASSLSPQSSVSVAMSPLSLGSLSPSSTTLSPEGQLNLKVEAEAMLTSTRKNLQFLNIPTSEANPKNISFQPLEELTRSFLLQNEDQRSKPTVDFKSSFHSVKPSTSFQTQQNEVKPSTGDHNNNRATVFEVNNSAGSSEINNNTVTVPAVVSLGQTSLPSIQQHQPHMQLSQQHLQQLSQTSSSQHQPQHPPQPSSSQQQQAAFQENTTVVSGMNQFHLIPTRTSTGEIAFVLSTANIISPAQLTNCAIPVITSTQNHAHLSIPSFQTQSVQLAMTYPQAEKQPVHYIIEQPKSQNQPISSNEISQTSQPSSNPHAQSTPLNLTSSNQHVAAMSNYTPTSKSEFSKVTSYVSSSVVTQPPQNTNPDHATAMDSYPPSSTFFKPSSMYTGSVAPPQSSSTTSFKPFSDSPSHLQSSTSVAVVKPHTNEVNTRNFRQHDKHFTYSQNDVMDSGFPDSSHSEIGKIQHRRDSNLFRPWDK